jgi:hypothetical protein
VNLHQFRPPRFFVLFIFCGSSRKKIEGKIRQIAADEANFFQDCCTTTVSVTSIRAVKELK